MICTHKVAGNRLYPHNGEWVCEDCLEIEEHLAETRIDCCTCGGHYWIDNDNRITDAGSCRCFPLTADVGSE